MSEQIGGYLPGEVAVIFFTGASNTSGHGSNTQADLPPMNNVWIMEYNSRVFTKFNLQPDVGGKYLYNNYKKMDQARVTVMSEYAKLWQGIIDAGGITPDLYMVMVADDGQGFSLSSNVADSSKFNTFFKRNDAAGTPVAPDWLAAAPAANGTNTSCFSLSLETKKSAISALYALGKVPRVIGEVLVQSEADAWAPDPNELELEYSAQIGIYRQHCAKALNIDHMPLWVYRTAGNPLSQRPSAPKINALWDKMRSSNKDFFIVEIAQLPGFVNVAPTYGGIYLTDGSHYSAAGCAKIAQEIFNSAPDGNFFGVRAAPPDDYLSHTHTIKVVGETNGASMSFSTPVVVRNNRVVIPLDLNSSTSPAFTGTGVIALQDLPYDIDGNVYLNVYDAFGLSVGRTTLVGRRIAGAKTRVELLKVGDSGGMSSLLDTDLTAIAGGRRFRFIGQLEYYTR